MDYQYRDRRIRRDMAQTLSDALYALSTRELQEDGLEIDAPERQSLQDAMEETEELLTRFVEGKDDPSAYQYHERPIAERVYGVLEDDTASLEMVARVVRRVRHGEYVEQSELRDAWDTLQRVEREIRPPRRKCF